MIGSPSSAAHERAAIGSAERWVSGSKEARESIKWIAAAVGLISAAVFGAGPLITVPLIDISEWEPARIATATTGATLGLFGVTVMLKSLLLALIPAPFSLDTLPTEFEARVDATPADYLPDLEDVDELRRHLLMYRRAAESFSLDANSTNSRKEAERYRERAHLARRNFESLVVAREGL